MVFYTCPCSFNSEIRLKFLLSAVWERSNRSILTFMTKNWFENSYIFLRKLFFAWRVSKYIYLFLSATSSTTLQICICLLHQPLFFQQNDRMKILFISSLRTIQSLNFDFYDKKTDLTNFLFFMEIVFWLKSIKLYLFISVCHNYIFLHVLHSYVLSTEWQDENSFYQQFEKDPIIKFWLLWQKTCLKFFLFCDKNYLLVEEYQNILNLSDSKKQ